MPPFRAGICSFTAHVILEPAAIWLARQAVWDNVGTVVHLPFLRTNDKDKRGQEIYHVVILRERGFGTFARAICSKKCHDYMVKPRWKKLS